MLNVVEGTSVTQHNAAASRSLSRETTTSAQDLTPPHLTLPHLTSPTACPSDGLIHPGVSRGFKAEGTEACEKSRSESCVSTRNTGRGRGEKEVMRLKLPVLHLAQRCLCSGVDWNFPPQCDIAKLSTCTTCR
ncbi:hypothetical protein Q7C36_022400 [Tachysurus vachellii]|uniref:Uncharacterized protein n=1 Tax=Tachysurus vachellii TaxID=175792 RepID=A0AA88J053_TACVA|nr:hypothetical protein Q7C36_022400 [Tachysurus vachellii]